MNSYIPNIALFHVEQAIKDNVTISSGSNKLYNDGSTSRYFEVPAVSNYTPIGIVGYYIDPNPSDGDGHDASLAVVYRLELIDTADTNVVSGKLIGASIHATAACKFKFCVNVLYIRN